jgi:alpha-L-rhamnosidase
VPAPWDMLDIMPQPIDLRCEHVREPLGFDRPQPRFSWVATGIRQQAWRIRCASSLAILVGGGSDRWDSGRVEGSASAGHTFGGVPLADGERLWWTVTLWDADGTACTAEPQWCERGLTDLAAWRAGWVGCPAMWTGRALLVRGQFELKQAVTRARLYVAGVGIVEPHLNGAKVGDRVLDPAPTDFSKRVLAAAYDVTDRLMVGGNCLGAIVGHGWAGQRAVMLALHLELADGTRRVVSTSHPDGASWDWQVRPGAWLHDSLFDGEVVDLRRQPLGWCLPGPAPEVGDDRCERWQMGYNVPGPGGRPCFTPVEPMRVVATTAPAAVHRPGAGETVIDAGANGMGWLRLSVHGAAAGDAVTLRHGEYCDRDGAVSQANLYNADCTDRLILAGADTVWEPIFTSHGFRHVAISHPATATVIAEVRRVRSDLARRGAFAIDHPLLTRIHAAILATEDANLAGVPTDCPQRPERMGWLNDMTARTEELVHNFHAPAFLRKWLDDLADAQDVRGCVPDTVPFHWGKRAADPICISPVLVPFHLWRHYADATVIGDAWDLMIGWMDWLRSRRQSDGLIHDSSWGDWAPPEAQAAANSLGSGALSTGTPGALVSTAHYIHAARLLARMARADGRTEAAAHWSAEALGAHVAFERGCWDEVRGCYGSGNQACNVLGLWLGPLSGERRDRALASLVAAVEDTGCHPTTGNLCTKYLPEVLTAHGRADLAFRILTRETYPSWGFMLASGATTLWERWENRTGGGMNSHNHPMFGAVGAWFYTGLAGLQDDLDAEPGEAYRLAPQFPDDVPQLSATLPVPRGTLAVSWMRVAAGIALTVEVPAGSRARLVLPPGWDAAIPAVLTGGTHQLRLNRRAVASA